MARSGSSNASRISYEACPVTSHPETSFGRAVQRAGGGGIEAIRAIPTREDSDVFEMKLSGRRVIVKEHALPTLIDNEV